MMAGHNRAFSANKDNRDYFSTGVVAIKAMRVIVFLAGILWVQQWAALAPVGWCLGAFAPLICWRRYPRFRWLYAGLLGVCWAVLLGYWRLHTVLPENLAGQDLVIGGYIASIPDLHERGFRFDFAVTEYPE